MATTNPSTPTNSRHDEPATTVARHLTWVRNFKAFVIVTVLFSLFSAYVAITRTVVAEKSFLALFAIASLASAWANLPIGPRIGWNRGGLPVVLVVFFVALVAYCFVALIAGGILYGIISTSTAYPPNQW